MIFLDLKTCIYEIYFNLKYYLFNYYSMNRRSSPNLKNVQKLLNIEIGTYLMKKGALKIIEPLLEN
jgi:hypothetical protein